MWKPKLCGFGEMCSRSDDDENDSEACSKGDVEVEHVEVISPNRRLQSSITLGEQIIYRLCV